MTTYLDVPPCGRPVRVIRRPRTVALVQQSSEHVVRGGHRSAVGLGGRPLLLAGGPQVRRRMPQTRVVQPQHRSTATNIISTNRFTNFFYSKTVKKKIMPKIHCLQDTHVISLDITRVFKTSYFR